MKLLYLAALLALWGCSAPKTVVKGESNREKAIVTRYITLILSGLKQTEGEALAKWRQEPLILGMIAFYYYRESDPDFARMLRDNATGMIAQEKISLDKELPMLRANFTNPKKVEDAVTVLSLWGFDPETSGRIVADARLDEFKAYESWIRGDGKKDK